MNMDWATFVVFCVVAGVALALIGSPFITMYFMLEKLFE